MKRKYPLLDTIVEPKIKINSPEFERLKGNIDLDDWVNRLIVTLGDRGCMYHKEGGFHYYDADSVDVFDLAGAGDTFLAALIAKYLETNNMDDAIKYANKKSAEVVQKKGVSVITRRTNIAKRRSESKKAK